MRTAESLNSGNRSTGLLAIARSVSRRWSTLSFGVTAVVLAACGGDRGITSSPRPIGPSLDQVRVNAPPPRPYRAATDGPLSPDRAPWLNIAALRERGAPRLPKHGGFGQVPPQGLRTDSHGAWTLFDGAGRGIEGDMAIGAILNGSSILFRDTIPTAWSDALLYAPTNLAHGGACIEATVIHWHGSRWGYPGVDHALGAWNWCSSDSTFAHLENMQDSAFYNRYAYLKTPPGASSPELAVTIEVYADNPAGGNGSYDCWHLLLWNARDRVWDPKFSSCGNSQVGTSAGWVMHEALHMTGYYQPGCPAIPSVFADGLWVMTSDGSWTNLLPPDLGVTSTGRLYDGNCFGPGTFWLSSTKDYPFMPNYASPWGWQAWTPTNAF